MEEASSTGGSSQACCLVAHELVMVSNESVENAGDILLKERMVRSSRCIPLPAVVNWFTRWMTPLKSQEQYGSCWSFSTTSSLKGDCFITNDNLSHPSKR